MGVYTENIFKLSIKELLKNLKDIEGAIKQTKARIERTEYKIERNLINARKGNYSLESLNESLAIWESKHNVNLRAFEKKCDAVAEEIEQMKREGKLFSEEE